MFAGSHSLPSLLTIHWSGGSLESGYASLASRLVLWEYVRTYVRTPVVSKHTQVRIGCTAQEYIVYIWLLCHLRSFHALSSYFWVHGDKVFSA